MKCLPPLVSLLFVFSLILTACAGAAPAAAGINATEPPATEAAAIPDTGATATPELVPVDLAGPPMQVGSFYTYIDGAILAAVPGGPFKMGYNNYFDAKEHEVTVSDFWIYTNEVTNEQYAWCVSVGKCTPPDATNNPNFNNYRFTSFPVTGVNYQQATDYCAFVNGRLPTEAEWEKAARGPDSNVFPWGDGAPGCSLLNFNFCKKGAIQVKSYPEGVSYYGLFDMSGNVKEWASDWYKPSYDLTQVNDPLGPELGQKRTVRSSSYSDSADFAFAAHRFSLNPIDTLPDLGFRCVVGDPTYFAPYCQGLTLYGADVNGAPKDPVVPVASDCPQPGLTTLQGDCETGWTKVTINPYPIPAGYDLTIDNSASCDSDRPTTQCTGSGNITYTPAECKLTPPQNADPSCAPGYQLEQDPNDPGKMICKGQGPGVNCPDGFEMNPLLNCCTAVNPGPHQYGFCVGFENSDSSCYNNPGEPQQPSLVSVSVSPPGACNENGGGDDGSCANPPTCGGRTPKFCSSTCSCVPASAPCP